MTRTAPFSAKAIRNACFAAAFAVAPLGLVGLNAIGEVAGQNQSKAAITECNQGNDGSCELVKAEDLGLITNEAWKTRKAEIAKAAEAHKAAKAKAAKEAADRKAAAEAKFKAEGWSEVQNGIFVRWCTDTCNNSKVIGDNRYSLMEVWAKDANAGDIYAQVNLMRNGVVVGWTNDTMYLSRGQRGVLTFDSYQYFDQAQLVKFNARG